jgi:transposase-like protein
MNFLRLADSYRNEEDAILFFREQSILHNPRKCARGHEMSLNVNSLKWVCWKRECRERKSIRIDTFLTGSKLPFRKILLFIYCWSKKLTTIEFCEQELEINHNTTVDWCNYMREVCADNLQRNPIRIGGPNTTVEIDESLFSRRKNNVGRVLPQQWVFGGVCRESRECFLVAVAERTAAQLMPIIKEYIRPGTTILSDEWRAYKGIYKLGYEHYTVNHTYNFVDPNSGAHTQTIESTWRLAKQRNKTQCGTRRALLDSYLCEFMWRRRHEGKNLFEEILRNIVEYWPPSSS